MKTTRLTRIELGLLAVLAVSLAGCDAFLAPLLGRWNPNDPSNELEEVVLSVVIDDGTIDSTDYRDFASTTLSVSDYNYGLIRFDASAVQLPEVVVGAQLTLTTDSGWAGSTVTIMAAGILQDWASNTVTYRTVDNPGVFYDDSRPASAFVDMPGTTYTWDLSALMQVVPYGALHGFVLRAPTAAAMSAPFQASESGAGGPVLHLFGYTP